MLTRRLDVESARVWDIHYRARERREAGEDVILLTVGDPDFDTPPAIVDEAGRSLRHRAHALRTDRRRPTAARGDRSSP